MFRIGMSLVQTDVDEKSVSNSIPDGADVIFTKSNGFWWLDSLTSLWSQIVPADVDPSDQVACCAAMIASCEACAARITVEEFCEDKPDYDGCPGIDNSVKFGDDLSIKMTPAAFASALLAIASSMN